MDEIVLQAMARWPNVPSVYGWLSLSRRGLWLIKDEPVSHPVMAEFISRNYEHDRLGRWYFQNGPQRVFVKLACTPLVLRLSAGCAHFVTHTGRTVHEIRSAWIDSCGVPIFETEHGPGVVDDRDAEILSARLIDRQGRALDDDALLESIERLQRGERTGLRLVYGGCAIELHPIETAVVPERFGFIGDPRPGAGEEAGT